jgi:hypothetical protein
MKIKRICRLMPASFFLMVAALATTGQCDSREAWGAAPQACTPVPGSAERREILDAMRKKVKELHAIDVIFVVRTMTVSKGWAWVHTLPRSKDGTRNYEDFYALLYREQGRWAVVEIPCTEPDNSDCIESPGYFKKLSARFSGLPSNILPEE